MTSPPPPADTPAARPRGAVLALAVLAGALLPTQFAINGTLARTLDSVTLAAIISYLGGTALLLALLGLSRGRPNWAAARSGPWWSWIGGVIGSAYVVGSVVLSQALGAALTTTLVIAAQVVTAILLDHFGAFGLPQRRINGPRLLALGLTLAALVVRFAGRA